MLVIFDCDGVLVDSEKLAADIFSQELKKVGISLSAQDCFKHFKGQSLSACFEWIEQQFSTTLPSNFNDIIADATTVGFQAGLQAVADVEHVLQYFKQRPLPFCLASNGSLAKIENSLQVTGLSPYFPINARFSGDQVAFPKPAPDLFNRAAEVTGVPNKFCWVVEDSLAGCIAAKRANMRLIFFNPHRDHAEFDSEHEPDLECHSMQQLRHMIVNGALN